jgi:hypothetical protein
MAIQIVNKDGKDCPFIYCDHCKLEIFEAELANAIWLGDSRGEEGFRFDAGQVHKECDDPFQRTHPAPKGSRWYWQGLNHHLYMLLKNCGYDGDKGKATKEHLDGIGF